MVVNFLANCSVGSIALLPPYLHSLGASQTFVGLFNVLGILMLVVVVLFFGRALVKLPRVKTMRWGYLITFVAYLLSWLASGSLAWLAVFRVLGSVNQILSSTLMVSTVLDLSPPDRRAGSLALFSVGGMLTNPVTSVAGEAVVRVWGGPGLFLMGAGFGVAALAWSFLLREPPVHESDERTPSALEVMARPELRPLFLLTFAFGMYYSALATFLPHHTLDLLGEANLSAFMVPFSLVAIGIRVFLGKEFDRRPPRRFLHLSFLAILLALVSLLLPLGWWGLILAGLLYGVGHSVLFPLLNTLVVQRGPEAHKASFSNAFTVVNLISAIVTTPLLGLLGDLWGFPAIVTVLALVAVGGFLVSRSTYPRPVEDPPSVHSS
jgi:predicted MFS family arabinose efflux permease